MSEIQIKQGNIIYEKGTSLTMVSIIIEGTVALSFASKTVELGAGDVIGLMDLCTNLHSCTYTATTDVVVDSYPYKSIDSLSPIFQEEEDFYTFFSRSALKQFFIIADFCSRSTTACDSLYSTLMEYYRDYTKLCKQYQVSAKNLPGLEFIQPLVLDSKPDEYIATYYKDLQQACNGANPQSLFSKSGFLSGFLYRISQDMHLYLNTYAEMEDYQEHLFHLLINEDKIDFLDLYTSLLLSAAHEKKDTVPLLGTISKMFLRTKGSGLVSADLHQQRLVEHRELTQKLEAHASEEKEAEHKENRYKAATEKVRNSLDFILDYADMEPEFCESFHRDVDTYREIVDKTAISSELSALRGRLTQGFFDLYKRTFFITLEKPNIPDLVKMFLYFGFVDEHLCGIENAIALTELLPTYRSDEAGQIYTFYDWLMLIYNGQKQPRRDEFDQDYPAFIQTMVNDGKITKADVPDFLNNPSLKVIFELDNMFTTAVKMTYGRLQTYCPLLSEHDFIKSPSESLLRPKEIKDAFRAITAVDFSAFYREVMYSDPNLPGGRELVQREILPDIILLPNIGIRAALWQEIEGRNRSTPGCMLFPAFCLTDLNLLAMRLTGEFRWEMCKRMQGSRWNDVSNSSLTSEYFDYLQFYKKNKDLSTEAKEKCRQQLARVKNRFREAFILDYIDWLAYESKGAPHMNKVTRKIFMTYCPFSAAYREALSKNPFYSAMLEKYDIKKTKDVSRMNSIVYRFERNKKPVPPEIAHQLEFLTK